MHHLTPPRVARQLCWVNNVWPKLISKDQDWSSDPPEVQKYCIMSMKNAFTGILTFSDGLTIYTSNKIIYNLK